MHKLHMDQGFFFCHFPSPSLFSPTYPLKQTKHSKASHGFQSRVVNSVSKRMTITWKLCSLHSTLFEALNSQ